MKIIIGISTFLFIAALLPSCQLLPGKNSTAQSWMISDSQEKTWAALSVTEILVDRTGGWDSIEKETSSLAPLYFWELGCKVVSVSEEPDYKTVIQIRERDFNQGWRSKKSLSVEVSIWDRGQELPAAVGRVTETGEKSFSSSQTLQQLLSKAIAKAVKELAAYKGQ